MTLYWPMTFTGVSPGGSYLFDRGPGHVPRYHQGIDINTGGTVGNPIYGSGDGVVTAVINTGRTAGYGLYVQVQYGDLQVRTAHMESVNVVVGQRVNALTLLGLSGGFKGSFGAGDSNGPHCHLETHVGANLVNPESYLVNRSQISGGGFTPIDPTNPQPPKDAPMSNGTVYQIKNTPAGGADGVVTVVSSDRAYVAPAGQDAGAAIAWAAPLLNVGAQGGVPVLTSQDHLIYVLHALGYKDGDWLTKVTTGGGFIYPTAAPAAA